MKFTHQAAAYASRLIERERNGAFDSTFTKHPELHNPTFWDMVMIRAKHPTSAQAILTALSELGADGAAASPYVAKNIYNTMLACRQTLRESELKRLKRIKH